MKTLKSICSKKQYPSLRDAKCALSRMLAMSKKHPERNEISVYKCDYCNQFHTSSKPTEFSPAKIKDKSYFELQNEKWSSFLHKYSAQKGRI